MLRRIQADFAEHSNARNEWAWIIGRIIVSNIFLALILGSGVSDAAWLSAVFSVAFVHLYSAASAVQLLRGKVVSAFALGTVGDVASLLGAWFALILGETQLFSEDETYLILFPILITLPYRYGVYVGTNIALALLGWFTVSQLIWATDRVAAIEEFPTRLLFLVSTLALATTFRHFLDQKAQELIRETEVLRRLDAAKSAFVGTVSHELRTPLTSMLAFISRFSNNKDNNLTDRQIELMKVVERNGWHLSMLVDDLVDVSKVERGELSYSESEFELDELLAETLTTMNELAGRGKHRVNVSGAPLIAVRADRNRFRQVLINLLSNAFKYSPPETDVIVEKQVAEGGLEVRVRNSGGGLSEEDRARMFDLFSRVNNERTRSQPGTGIGLYISRVIMRDHGGDLWAESDARTTTLCLTVPAERILSTGQGSGKFDAAA